MKAGQKESHRAAVALSDWFWGGRCLAALSYCLVGSGACGAVTGRAPARQRWLRKYSFAYSVGETPVSSLNILENV